MKRRAVRGQPAAEGVTMEPDRTGREGERGPDKKESEGEDEGESKGESRSGSGSESEAAGRPREGRGTEGKIRNGDGQGRAGCGWSAEGGQPGATLALRRD